MIGGDKVATKRTVAKETIDNIVQELVRVYRPIRIILFGSSAKGSGREGSDIDLLIIKKTDKDRLERAWEVYRILRGKRKGPLDVVVLTPAEYEEMKEDKHSFIQEIEEEGIILYEKVS